MRIIYAQYNCDGQGSETLPRKDRDVLTLPLEIKAESGMTKGVKEAYGNGMKILHLLTVSAAVAVLPILAPALADAQARPAGGGFRTPPPVSGHHGGKHGGFHIPFLIVQRNLPVIIEREVVVREVPAAPPAPPPEPREPYVVGKSYASLPASCMKLIEGGASYYYCGGQEWYRAAGKRYLAIAKP